MSQHDDDVRLLISNLTTAIRNNSAKTTDTGIGHDSCRLAESCSTLVKCTGKYYVTGYDYALKEWASPFSDKDAGPRMIGFVGYSPEDALEEAGVFKDADQNQVLHLKDEQLQISIVYTDA